MGGGHGILLDIFEGCRWWEKKEWLGEHHKTNTKSVSADPKTSYTKETRLRAWETQARKVVAGKWGRPSMKETREQRNLQSANRRVPHWEGGWQRWKERPTKQWQLETSSKQEYLKWYSQVTVLGFHDHRDEAYEWWNQISQIYNPPHHPSFFYTFETLADTHSGCLGHKWPLKYIELE